MVTPSRPDLTFRGNSGVARHGWLRLTPAYGVRVVNDELARYPDAEVVLDPFSGTGTTALCAETAGRRAHLVDLNPFLIWLATTKTRHYADADAFAAIALADDVADAASELWLDASLWQPGLSNIDRWWSPSALAALRGLRAACDKYTDAGSALDLMLVALCQTLIESSTAAFNHQSMSFKDGGHTHDTAAPDLVQVVIDKFRARAHGIVEECEPNPPGQASVHLGDARRLAETVDVKVDLLITSPPYCNRMSYIRELRPYMYWLRFLEEAREAGELDWQAIGGTWGTATSRLMSEHLGEDPPLSSCFVDTVSGIAASPGQRNAQLLSNYVYKYFADAWEHIKSTTDVMAPGGELVYIVGNSTFFGTVVPTQDWYAELLAQAGYANVTVEMIRKRNSNKLLYEYAVRARKDG